MFGSRSSGVLSALACAVIVAAGSTNAVPELRLSASALIMGGTNQVLSIPPQTPEFIENFVGTANAGFIAPSGLCTGGDPGCDLVAVYTPEELRFVTGFDDLTFDESVAVGRANLDACLRGAACMATSSPFVDTTFQQLSDGSFVVQGISQSAVISTYEKSYLIAHPVSDTSVSFILVSNPNRPNGGFFERFVGGRIPFFGITLNGATPTNSPESNPMLTIDVARQYDGWVDFPTNPANLLATVNAVLGAAFLHHKPLEIGGSSQLQGYYQDSTYYLQPSPVLPLLIPLTWIPVIGTAMALAVDAPLRVLVEAGYDRRVNPGEPTPARWLYHPKLIDTVVNLVRAVPTGWDDAIAYATGDPTKRPFHTEPQGAYGVGGPPVYAGAVDPYGPVSAEPAPAPDLPAPAATQSADVSAQATAPLVSAASRPAGLDPGSHRRDRTDRRTAKPRPPAAAAGRVHRAGAGRS